MIAGAPRADDGLVPAAFLDATAARVTSLDGAWEFSQVSPGRGVDPADLAGLVWRPAAVPGTAAGSLRALGELDEHRGCDLDEREFVWRRRFPHDGASGRASLAFEGLATLADVWLNGERVLCARNMFRRHVVDAGQLLRPENEIVIHCRALGAELARRRPRGRWTTRLVGHRNLRFFRTSLLGRMPGWAPAFAPVGPWRGIRLIEGRRIEVAHLHLDAMLDGADGVVSVVLRGRAAAGSPPEALELRIGDRSSRAATRSTGDGFEVEAELRVPAVSPWWTHELGTPRRYPLQLALHSRGEELPIASVQIGFRHIERLEATAGDLDGFGLRMNGRDVFCRGACWTPADVVGLGDDPAEIRRVLGLVRDAGMNMLRVNGTMIYESDAFYDTCDELGILVWQDFMFARMDYPEADAEFAEEVRLEAEQVLARLHHHPCLAALCGNSEVEQQAAMMGLAPDAGKTPLFESMLREASRSWCPRIPYVSSSPTGGTLPFHVDAGVAHYFGVGAYLRPLADARESRVRFATECLAFSNVPEDEALDELFAGEVGAAHSPRFKEGVPRDSGSGWDFADVTDHYIEQLFHVDIRSLRYADTARYLALARVAPGEMMERAFGLWRAEGSVCRGALIWFLRDLRVGAGWGVLDNAGRPKAAYWFLKRACAPRALWFTDEGLNGLRLHVRNDGPALLDARLRVRLIRGGGVEIGNAEAALDLAPHSGRAIAVEALLGRFVDASYAYRFGPSEHAITVAELVGADGSIEATAHHLAEGLGHVLRDEIGLRAVVKPRGADHADSQVLCVESRELALFVRIAIDGFLPADNYFHLHPGGAREIELRRVGPPDPLRGRVEAINARSHAMVSA